MYVCIDASIMDYYYYSPYYHSYLFFVTITPTVDGQNPALSIIRNIP